MEEHCKIASQAIQKAIVVVDNKGFQLFQSRAKLIQHTPPVRPLIPFELGLAKILANDNVLDALDSVEEGVVMKRNLIKM